MTAVMELLSVGIDELMPDPTQPRKTFLKEEIERLAASIQARGLLLPLRVVRDDERECWRIVTGECRWRAARLAGLTQVPCLPVAGEVSETDILSDQIVENSVRNSLRPLELSRALAKLKALKGCTAQQLARELGLSAADVTRTESLLTLPEDIQALVDAGAVPESTAYEISRHPDEKAQRHLAGEVASGRMNREAVQRAVQATVGQKQVKPKDSRLALHLDGGLSVTVTAGQPLTWDDLLAALDRIRKEAKKLYDGGKEVAALAKALAS